ncbi:MAG: hypothetical protein CMI56_00055 [Parcubacteria group bacterium]|nr:hypothetical protein [Parcubacteria group bacterium]
MIKLNRQPSTKQNRFKVFVNTRYDSNSLWVRFSQPHYTWCTNDTIIASSGTWIPIILPGYLKAIEGRGPWKK